MDTRDKRHYQVYNFSEHKIKMMKSFSIFDTNSFCKHPESTFIFQRYFKETAISQRKSFLLVKTTPSCQGYMINVF